jgi:hypothetical protein
MPQNAAEKGPDPLPKVRFEATAGDARETPRASALILTELIQRLGLIPLISGLGMDKDGGVEVEHVILVFLLMATYGATSVRDLVIHVDEDTALEEICGGINQITDRVLGYYNKQHEIDTLEQLADQFVRVVQGSNRFESTKDGVVALDDSTMRKFGKTMEHIAVVYDHCDNVYYLGYVMVSTCYCDSKKAYPINFEFRIQTEEERRRAEEAKLKTEAELDFRKKGSFEAWLDVLAENNRLPPVMSIVGNHASIENFKAADARSLPWVAQARESLDVYDIAGKTKWSWEELRKKTLANKPDSSEVEGLRFYTKEVSLKDYDHEADFVIVKDFGGQTIHELLMPRMHHQQRVERILRFREREGDPEATKLDIGVRLVRRAKEKTGIKAETVAADAWFFVVWFVDALLKVTGIKRVVSRLKANQLVTYKGQQMRVDELWKLPGLAFRHERKKHFKWTSLTVCLAGLGDVRLVLVQELDEARPWRVIARYVLVCTDVTYSPLKIVAAYKLRWGIEVFYRTAKQRFSLTEFHSPSFLAIHFHVTFVFLAYLMTAVLRQFNPALANHTLGEIIDEYLRCLVSIRRRGHEIIVSVGPKFAALFGLSPPAPA